MVFSHNFRLIDFILGHQLSEPVLGDILEIGSYEGKSTILLGYGLRDDETLVVCDLFGLNPADFQAPTEFTRIGACAGLTVERFQKHYDRFHRRPQTLSTPSALRR